jgi:ribonuclease HII
MIVGIDEVGRGCWAGPLVAGAVLLDTPIKGLKDSKLLTRVRRERLDAEIRVSALSFGLGWVSPAEIDRLGLTGAVKLAMERAFKQIAGMYEKIIIDGNHNFLAHVPKTEVLIGADNLVPAVSAASIIAKVARDRFMGEMSVKFPGYGFEKHVGYGTAAHRQSLARHGLCELHRRSFKPIQALLAA